MGLHSAKTRCEATEQGLAPYLESVGGTRPKSRPSILVLCTSFEVSVRSHAERYKLQRSSGETRGAVVALRLGVLVFGILGRLGTLWRGRSTSPDLAGHLDGYIRIWRVHASLPLTIMTTNPQKVSAYAKRALYATCYLPEAHNSAGNDPSSAVPLGKLVSAAVVRAFLLTIRKTRTRIRTSIPEHTFQRLISVAGSLATPGIVANLKARGGARPHLATTLLLQHEVGPLQSCVVKPAKLLLLRRDQQRRCTPSSESSA